MFRAFGVVMLLLVIAAALWVWRDRSTSFSPDGATAAAGNGAEQAPTRASDPSAPADDGLPDNTVATRVAVTPQPVEDLATEPTAWLRVLDRDTKLPIAGAAVRSVQGGIELAFTDDDGLAALPLTKPLQLAVIADDHLLRLVPTQLDSSERQPQEVLLVRDPWTHRLRVVFTAPGGAEVADVWVQFRLLEPPGTLLTPPGRDVTVQRAFREHSMLARLPVGADLPIEDGGLAPLRTHRLGEDALVRFVTAGRYAVTAATTAGLVAEAELQIPAEPNGGRSELRLALRAGSILRGHVVTAAGAPIVGATVRVEAGDPLELVATTDAAGAFGLGPLAPQSVRLHAHHVDHEPLAFGPVSAATQGARLAMQPLPAGVVRGRVRSRPALTPIEAAVVGWTVAGSSPITTRTDAQGRFALRTTGSGAARLFVQAQGHVPYAELVDPGAPFADYDVLPAVPAVRAQKGLTTLLCGAVVDAAGQPVVGLPVRWVPDAVSAPIGMPGRRTLEGAVLDLPGLTTTGLDGSFTLETDQFGSGRVCLPDDVASPSRGLRLSAVAGETKNGLVLQR